MKKTENLFVFEIKFSFSLFLQKTTPLKILIYELKQVVDTNGILKTFKSLQFEISKSV